MILTIIYTILLSNSARIIEGSQCYPNYCQEKTLEDDKSDVSCFVEPVQNNDECVDLDFEALKHFPPQGEDLAKLQLMAYIENDLQNRSTTAFNLTINDTNIRKLTMRYQNVGNEKLAECYHVELLNNMTDINVQSNLFISCSLANETYETSPYRLEYIVSTDKYEYSRKLVFIIPRHKFIDSDNADVKSYVPFIYADVSDTSELSLYIQPLPAKFKIHSYRIWLLNNETQLVKNVTVASFDDNHIRYNFPVHHGVYYFKVATLHPDCDIYGCINSTSPLISIKHSSHRILIMIISVIWIPPVIFYALFNAYKVYRKSEKLKRAERKPKCLLVYHPTHTLHINVMLELAKYLRGCNIHAMIDILDLSESTNKDPTAWYNEMFHIADIILWAASPAPIDGFVLTFTETVENEILTLAKDYQMWRSKKFYILQFPYCNTSDLPPEAYSLKLFTLPEELSKLVKTINNVDYIRFFGVSSKMFVETVKAATVEFAYERNRESNKHADGNEIPLLMEKSSNSDSEGISETALRVDESDEHCDKNKRTAEQLTLLNKH